MFLVGLKWKRFQRMSGMNVLKGRVICVEGMSPCCSKLHFDIVTMVLYSISYL
jgi:hypothetical protein